MRVLSALPTLAAAILLCSGCRTDKPATPATPAAPAWMVDHVAIVNGIYTAFCAPTDTVNPAHVPTDDELSPVTVSENQFLRLQPGDACPGR